MLPESTFGAVHRAAWISATASRCAIGDTTRECYDNLVDGRSGLGPLQGFPRQRFRVSSAYQVTRPRRVQRERGLATALVAEVISQAAREHGLATLAGIPILVGTGLGEARTIEAAWLDGDRLSEDDCAMAAGIQTRCGADDVQVFSNACSASLFALAAGCDLIAGGTAPVVVVAGVDVLSQSMFGLLDRVHLQSPDRVRPFDADRAGVIMGDGAAAVVLTRERPAAAGPAICVRGVALSCDAYHPTAPDAEAIADTIRTAHRLSGIGPDGIDAVFAHGTGTVLNDRAEAQALAVILPAGVPVTSVKGATGHTSGASGLFSVCMAVAAFERGVLPGTLGLERRDDAARDLRVLDRAARAPRLRRVQVNAFGFGGLNAVAVLEKVAPVAAQATASAAAGSAPESRHRRAALAVDGQTGRPAPLGHSPTEHRPTGHSPTGHSPAGHSPAGHSPLGHSPTGHGPLVHGSTGHGPLVHSPFGSARVLAAVPCFPDAGVLGSSDPAVDNGPLDLTQILGRRGLRDTTPAARAALAAAVRAARDAGWAPALAHGTQGRRTAGSRLGVVAASSHGNTAVVCRTAQTIDAEGVAATSALDLPSASRNVLAAKVAIRLGVTGPCLTIDTAGRSGWDALRWSLRLLQAGRCDAVLCIAAEAPDEVVSRLTGTSLAHGAVALVLGRISAAEAALLDAAEAALLGGGDPDLLSLDRVSGDGPGTPFPEWLHGEPGALHGPADLAWRVLHPGRGDAAANGRTDRRRVLWLEGPRGAWGVSAA